MAPNKTVSAEAEATPKSPKGSRTRERLLEAAREVFGRDRFLGARVTDIAATAGLAHGTFYRYFESKEDILRALLEGTIHELYEAPAVYSRREDPYEWIAEGCRRYLESYRRNADIMKVLIEAAMQDDDFSEMWQQVRSRSLKRIEATLEENQRKGWVRDVHPAATVSALNSMLEHFAFMWFVEGGTDFPEGEEPTIDEAAETFAKIWYHGLFLDRSSDGKVRRGR